MKGKIINVLLLTVMLTALCSCSTLKNIETGIARIEQGVCELKLEAGKEEQLRRFEDDEKKWLEENIRIIEQKMRYDESRKKK